MYEINGKVTELCLEIQRNIDAENAATRDAVVHNSKHIWDLILPCVKLEIIDEFNRSMDAWWGAKKYIVAGGCALIQVPLLVATAGLSLPSPSQVLSIAFCRG